ncbi:MAG: SLC13 family permease [Clostridiaceae bacterium]|nr:SLC13 family permease [Clostridiaceae bacterium]
MCALSIVWAGLLPLGGNAGAYLGTNAIIENLGGIGTMTYFSTMIAKLPIALVLTLFAIFWGHKITPDNGLVKEVDASAVEKAKKFQKGSELPPEKEKLAILLFAATIIGIVCCALTKNDVTKPACLGALITVMLGIVKPKEVPGKIQLPILLIFVGSLPLSTALAKTGGDVVIADLLKNLLGGTTNPYVILGVIYLFCGILTQFMSNSAVGSSFKTLAILLAVQCGYDARACFLANQLGSNCAFVTPMASPTQTISFGEGNYTMKQFVKAGLPYWIIYFVGFIIWVPLVFPC